MNIRKIILAIFAIAFFSYAKLASTAVAEVVVEFNTNFGIFEVELFDNQTPISVANFLSYANAGDYNNTVIHRSIQNFVIQGGGFQASGAALQTHGTIMNEVGLSNVRGTLAYANTGSPNSATSQWYFNVVDNPFLDSNYTVFGFVRGNGMNIVDQINSLPTINIGGAFTNLPVVNPNAPLFASNLAIINSITTISSSASAVPEPSSAVLAALPILGGVVRRRKRQSI
jgi:cyclophilin family peptidyl-prolyl cis-trans isomerase